MVLAWAHVLHWILCWMDKKVCMHRVSWIMGLYIVYDVVVGSGFLNGVEWVYALVLMFLKDVGWVYKLDLRFFLGNGFSMGLCIGLDSFLD